MFPLLRSSTPRHLPLKQSPSPLQSKLLLLPPRASARFHPRNPTKDRLLLRFSCFQIRCKSGGDNLSSVSDAESSSINDEGTQENRNHTSEPITSNETLKKLKRYGISGILSYGLLNTAYYLTTFLLVWFYFAPAPGKMGYLAAVER
ncbi:hypothetical protein CDL15_Pgr016234 [Punica granatum]|nr:hypothetical protein CDL15_Pgr016234 [Punica granatum]